MASNDPFSSLFSLNTTRPADDTVFYSIYPDSATTSSIQTLHLQILRHISPITTNYIWQHQPFNLSISPTPIPHLSGRLRYGDSIEDEWFVVYLIFHISNHFPDLSIQLYDSDGEFLLIETASHLPKWLNPETSENRIFIRRGLLHIIPQKRFASTPELVDALNFLKSEEGELIGRAPDTVQLHLRRRIEEYPERARRNMHRVRVRVPVTVAWVLRNEPSFVSLAVDGFYDRDVDSMKYAARMERFLMKGKGEEMVEVVVTMARTMYAQLAHQKFQAPSCYPMPEKSNVGKYVEADLGMKIACGLEMMYQMRKKQGEEGKGSTWEAFRSSLESSGYFKGLLPGSKEYNRLMENAEQYYRNSSAHDRTSEVLSAPVKRIEEILALPHSADDLNNQDLTPSDDDSWLYGAEDEINAYLQERQHEMDAYDTKHKEKQKLKEQQDGGSANVFDLEDIAKSMEQFVKTCSSFEGAEIPEDRTLNNVDFDADQFMRDLESVMKHGGSKDNGSDLAEEGSSSDLDFDVFEDDSEQDEDAEEGTDAFMSSYSDALSKELKSSTLNNTFVHAQNEESLTKNDEGTSTVDEEMDELTPVDVDINLVKNLLDSYASQEGMPGPASNLLGLMGLQLPDDAGKGK